MPLWDLAMINEMHVSEKQSKTNEKTLKQLTRMAQDSQRRTKNLPKTSPGLSRTTQALLGANQDRTKGSQGLLKAFQEPPEEPLGCPGLRR